MTLKREHTLGGMIMALRYKKAEADNACGDSRQMAEADYEEARDAVGDLLTKHADEIVTAIGHVSLPSGSDQMLAARLYIDEEDEARAAELMDQAPSGPRTR